MQLRPNGKMRVWLLAVLAVLVTIAGLGTADTGPAFALSHEECTAYYFKCMNDWSGQGIVKVGEEGWPNENFGWTSVKRCNGNYYVTATCPFNDTTIDHNLQGWVIGEFVYPNQTLNSCLAEGYAGPGLGGIGLGTCANPADGSGGSNGVIQVMWQNLQPYGCFDTNGTLKDIYATNRFMSDLYSQQVTIQAPTTGDGGQIYFNYDQGTNNACWESADH